jgi:excisionase family DNA binding protein
MGSKTKRIASGSEGTQTGEQARAYYSIDAAAERLSVGRSTIERLLHGGTVGYFRIGRRLIIPADSLLRYEAFLLSTVRQRTQVL